MKLKTYWPILILQLISSMALAAPMDRAKLSPPLAANLWIEMSKITQPGVVGVYVDLDTKARKPLRRDPMFDFLEEFFGHTMPFEENDSSSPIGTGFLIDKEGHIITNYHVISAAENPRAQVKLRVQIAGESELHNVKILGHDARGDIALLKLEKPITPLQPLELGDSDSLQVGEYVAAFGNPFGHSNSMTVGIVSALGRTIKEINRFPFIQTDASINPGNSGGPLLNTKGYVIGVNTAIDARAQGIGFAIPVNYVKKVLSIIKSGGVIQRAFLGVGLAPVHPRLAQTYGIKRPGVLVTQVEAGYPGAEAGLQENDYIYEFNSQKVTSVEDFINSVQDSEIGKPLPIKVLRSKDNGPFVEVPLTVKLIQYPGDQKLQQKAQKPKYRGLTAPYNIGFSVETSSSGARHYFKVPYDFAFGPIISQVSPGSLADQVGIKVGEVILEVNNQEVNSASDVIKTLRRGSNTIILQSDSGQKTVLLNTTP